MTNQTVSGSWRDGKSTDARQVRVSWDDNDLIIEFSDQTRLRQPLKQAIFSSRIAGVPTTIRFVDDSLLIIPDSTFALNISKRSGIAALIEGKLLYTLPAMLLSATFILYLLYAYALPAFGVFMVNRVSVATINKIGDMVFENLEEHLSIELVDDDPHYAVTVAHVNEIGAELLGYVPANVNADEENYNYRFLVASGAKVGANAFALPNGHIIVTHRLYEMLTEDELAAVISHEIGHVELRHSMQQLARTGAWYALLNLLFTDVLFVALPLVLAESAFSRDDEREADCYSADLLVKSGRSPAALVSVFDRFNDVRIKSQRISPEQEAPIEESPDNIARKISEAIAKVLAGHPEYEGRTANIYSCADLPGPP